MEVKYPPSYEHWDNEQRIRYHTRMVYLYAIGVGICYAIIGIGVIVLLAAFGDFVFGWTA